MNRVLAVAVTAVASGATLVAVVGGTDATLVVPAGAVAVGSAALLLVGIVERTRWPVLREMPTLRADPERVRSMLQAGSFGRPSLVRLLDALDRTGGHPDASLTSPDEITRLQSLPREQFQAYLDLRVSDLERGT